MSKVVLRYALSLRDRDNESNTERPLRQRERFEKTFEKLLTNEKSYDIVIWLSQVRQQRTLKTEQYVKP